MLERDWFMRQIRQLTQALQQVIMQKQQGQLDEAQRTLQQAIGQVDNEGRDTLRSVSLDDTLRFCTRDGAFRPAFATTLADLLIEEGDLLTRKGDSAEAQKSYARALLLYRRTMRGEQATIPWNMSAKLSDLEAHLGDEEMDAIDRALDNGRASD